MAGGVLAPQPFGLVVNRDIPQLSAPYQGSANPFPFAVDSSNAQFVLPVSIPKSYSRDLRVGYSMNYNFGVQQQLGGNYMVEVAYVGNLGRKLPQLRELNIAQLTPNATTGSTNARRIYAPNYTSIGQLQSAGVSNYNALQIQLQKRFSGGFTLNSSYTYAKAIDDWAQLSQQTYQDPLNRRADRGRMDEDFRHRWATSFLYELPFFRGDQWYGRVLGGWELGAILIASTGDPFTVVTGRDNSLSGINNDRPDVVGDWRLPSGRSRGDRIDQYFNQQAFRENAPRTFGNAGRNIISSPGSLNLDTSLSKSIRITESQRVQLRFDAFNLPNRPDLGSPNATLTSPAFGRIQSAGSGRVLQVSAKYIF
jgi:hypothetical protein